jgi:uncharacterized protein YndB with AHSA1/START domain
MTELTGSVTIARPPGEVFAYLDDLPRHAEWQADLQENKVLTEGPTRVGTEVAATRRVGGRTMHLKWRIIEHDPPRRTVFETYEGQMAKPRGTVTVDPVDDGSRVTFSMDPRFEGLGKVLGPLMIARQMRKSITSDLARLKAKIEG